MTRKMIAELFKGPEEDRMQQAADVLLDARRTLQPIADLPVDLRPTSLDEAYFLQDLVLEAFGDVGGWKVGASNPEAEPACAPMPASTMAKSGVIIAESFRRMRGVEAEIAFQLGRDLPVRSAPYTRDEVVEAIASCHPAIELMESAFIDPDRADRLSVIGDLQSHGGFIYGDPVPGGESLNFSKESAVMVVDGVVRTEDGTNGAGPDLLRLVEWLANQAQYRTGGLAEGQWITTGSWTGRLLAFRGSEVIARFKYAGTAALRFA
jgi:2-keto-4-pentenoate hydratase